ncbi:unnamed protein product, partial [Owenia fusiformis]
YHLNLTGAASLFIRCPFQSFLSIFFSSQATIMNSKQRNDAASNTHSSSTVTRPPVFPWNEDTEITSTLNDFPFPKENMWILDVLFLRTGYIINRLFIHAQAQWRKNGLHKKGVKACKKHRSQEGDHWLMASGPRCNYEQLLDNSMSITFEWPKGANCTAFNRNYWFRCENSCPSKMEGRDSKVVFTFEDISGQVFGRVSFDVWVTTTPVKDLEIDEHELKYTPNPKSEAKQTVSEVSHPDPIESEVFVIHVRGKKNFQLLQKIRDAMETADELKLKQKKRRKKKIQLNTMLLLQ